MESAAATPSSASSSPSARNDPSGDSFGPYQVVRYLATGGMADLYLAREPGRREPLVLKRVQARYLDNPKVIALFLDEGEIGALLNHPNIVRVHGAGQAQGFHYIAMEYIHGHDLVETLRSCTAQQVPVPRDLAVALCEKVARGLSYAHELRDQTGRPLEIIHCDISPGNVMISFGGAVKLVDFGVARARIPLHCPERGVAGKYNYMAPEQILGAPLDRRADLFSLGVILHELTSGQRLFKGRPEGVMRQIVEEPIPTPQDLCPNYPAALAAIVMRLLERDPAQRYPTAEALRVDLQAFLDQEAQHHGKRHGKREMAHFLRTVFRRQGGEEDPAESGAMAPLPDDTVDLPRSATSGARRSPPSAAPAADLAAGPAAAGAGKQDSDLTTEAALPAAGGDDREESFLTRCNNPILDSPNDDGGLTTPLPRDPDRTNLLRLPGDSGGITTHLLGEGGTYPKLVLLPPISPESEDGAMESAAAAHEKDSHAPNDPPRVGYRRSPSSGRRDPQSDKKTSHRSYLTASASLRTSITDALESGAATRKLLRVLLYLSLTLLVLLLFAYLSGHKTTR